jgi:hypothetical protein
MLFHVVMRIVVVIVTRIDCGCSNAASLRLLRNGKRKAVAKVVVALMVEGM